MTLIRPRTVSLHLDRVVITDESETNSLTFLLEGFSSGTNLKIESYSRSGSSAAPTPPALSVRPCAFLLGVINLHHSYVLYAPSCSLVGELRLDGRASVKIFQLDEIQVLRIPSEKTLETAASGSGPSMADEEQYFLKCLVESLLEKTADSLFFSFEVDLTNNTQQLQQKRKPTADKNFQWNDFLLEPLRQAKCADVDRWMVSAIFGHVSIQSRQINTHEYTYALLNRRSTRRAGTRFNRRGIDTDGAAANSVETEQLLVVDRGPLFSFVQVRGSLPFYWRQPLSGLPNPPTLPRATTALDDTHEAGFRRHMEALGSRYGPHVSVVSLLDCQGREQWLTDQFRELSQQYAADNPSFHWHCFDFHRECHNNHYENVQRLVEAAQAELDNIGYFEEKASGDVRLQNGVFRVNCLDCLDRTNVVQFHIALAVLRAQLSSVDTEAEQTFNQLTVLARRAWADAGDALSLQNTGTSSQKSDFTRFGRRTWKGKLADTQRGAARLWQNNFHDGSKQDGYDLLLGVFRLPARPARPTVVADHRVLEPVKQWKAAVLNSLAVILSLLLVSRFLAPTGLETGIQSSSYLFWLIFALVIYQLLTRCPALWTEQPALITGPVFD